ncbi:hypothetical protein BEL04_20660 [Mucilaginibacter sp. PPCGB 2223]|uniref:DUF4397 domain-containing protein n=1 Tax=Mucilaginibacter sp. PPCGB 2223 TaxID=1886027 RepID=UPI0008249FB3|nr:DUF4397 domain-containing protein [Mucilaginibacter sp. PPCGB 2223]OCX51124.1 hypothetical protein BEL04_20660 [Mucilaginibacter sp. PPCGB 2223]
MKKIFYIAACAVAFALSSCDKSVITQAGVAASGVQLKFFHAAPGVPALDAYANGVQVTPQQTVSVTDNALPGSITTGYIFNGVFPASNYAVVASGNTAIKVVASTPVPALISPQTVAPATVITNVTQATTSGDAYSIITSGLPGSVATPVTSFVVKDVFPTPAAGMAYVRLAHMIPNGGAVDIAGTYTPTGGSATTATVITNVSYGTIGQFVAVPVNALGTTTYTFQAYLTGTTTKLGATTAPPLTPGRYYTLVLKGLAADYAVPNTSITLKASARPSLPVTDPQTKYPEIYFNAPGLNYYTNK